MGKLLEKIRSPKDLKALDREELEALCEEIRTAIIDTVSHNGGHLASNLGVVELTVALGLAFDPPQDTIVWDVGHQSYAYKLLTGRYPRFSTIRQEGGPGGLPQPGREPLRHVLQRPQQRLHLLRPGGVPRQTSSREGITMWWRSSATGP